MVLSYKMYQYTDISAHVWRNFQDKKINTLGFIIYIFIIM